MVRRFGVNRLILDGIVHLQCVVTVKDGEVIDFHPLTEELPFTEWRGGTVELIRDNGRLVLKQ